MIEKNIRLQPHHARDLLVGRRSDGRRPGYQPPGHGPGESRNGRSGPPGGGGGHHSPPSRPAPAPSRPAPAPAPAPSPSPHRDPAPAPTPNRVSPQQSMAMTGNTSLAGKTQSQAQASVDRDNASRNIHVDTPKIKAEQDKLQLRSNTSLVYNSISSKIKEKLFVQQAGHNLFISNPDQDMIFQKVVSFFNQFRDHKN